MKKLISVSAAAAAIAAFAATPASAAEGKAYGKNIQTAFGAPYGQLLNSVRNDTDVHGVVVFPPAAGAKTFYEVHAPSGS
jgi:hypothetical protein